jgi:hypothetical protein
VDNQNKVVFNGSDLGKGYSAAALQSRLGSGEKDVSATQEKKSGDTSNSKRDKIQQKQFDKSNDLPVKNVYIPVENGTTLRLKMVPLR